MASLQYSADALSVQKLFHGVKYVIYVEGPTDVIFWKDIFINFGLNKKSFFIKEAGGSSELDKYINSIVVDNADIVVARDRDYKYFCDDIPSHERVLLTHSHSMENTYYDPVVVGRIMSSLVNCDEDDVSSNFNDIRESLIEKIRDMIIYEVASYKFDKGVEVLGENCHRLLLSKNSYALDDEKIRERIQEIKNNISQDEFDSAIDLIDGLGGEYIDLVRGHFLTAIVRNFLIHQRSIMGNKKARSIDHDELYALCNMAFIAVIVAHPHYEHYKSAVTPLLD